jgi:site-specific DNA-methyltransferase (adenine-specific)
VEVDRLIVGDCRQALREFPDGCFDACITDPPYGAEGSPWPHLRGANLTLPAEAPS